MTETDARQLPRENLEFTAAGDIARNTHRYLVLTPSTEEPFWVFDSVALHDVRRRLVWEFLDGCEGANPIVITVHLLPVRAHSSGSVVRVGRCFI